MTQIGFIFDLDGTLVNSTDIIKGLQDKVMKKFNINLTPEREEELKVLAESMFQETYSTSLAVKIMWTLMKEVGLSFKQRIHAFIFAGKQYFKEIKKVRFYDGVEELLAFLDENATPYVIVTSASWKEVVRNLQNHPEFFERMKKEKKIICKDNVDRVKPNPEALYKASEIMGVPFNKIVMVGDTKYDIQFGKNNGTLTIGVLTGIYTREWFLEMKPDFVLDSVIDIPKIYDQILKKLK
ncbi:MAG: HAD family hydrolase [Promethearchaeota archaeon]